MFQTLIQGYEKAYPCKNGQQVQQEVCKVWRDIKKANKTEQLSVATDKQLAEWKQIEMRKRGTLLSFWSKVNTLQRVSSSNFMYKNMIELLCLMFNV